jgi:hypothetical protein
MHIAFQVYDLVDKHIRELDEDLKSLASGERAVCLPVCPLVLFFGVMFCAAVLRLCKRVCARDEYTPALTATRRHRMPGDCTELAGSLMPTQAGCAAMQPPTERISPASLFHLTVSCTHFVVSVTPSVSQRLTRRQPP